MSEVLRTNQQIQADGHALRFAPARCAFRHLFPGFEGIKRYTLGGTA